MKICFIIFLFVISSLASAEEAGSQVVKVTRGDIAKKIIVSGELFSPNSSAVRINRYGDTWENKISWIADEGSFIKKGDVVLKLDTSNIEKNLEQTKDQLLSAELNLKTAELKLKIDITAGEADIQSKQYALEKAKLDVQTGDYVPLNDQKKALIALNSAKADLAQSKKNLEQNTQSDKLQIESLQAPVKQYQSKAATYQDDIKKMSITADSDGYIIYNYISTFNGGKVRPAAGVSPFPFSKVADISNTTNLQARLYIPEIDSSSVKENVPVKISLLSNPDEYLTGKVTSINKIPATALDSRGGEAATPSDLLPQNTAIVTLDNMPSDAIPGMTIKAIVFPLEKKNVLKIPLFMISSEPKNNSTSTSSGSPTIDTVSNHNETYVFARKKSEKKWQWHKITIGETSYGFAEVTGGLEEGDLVSRHE